MTKRLYIDSDILIWHLRGEARAMELLRRLSQEAASELWMGALQRAEVVFFMRRDEQEATQTLLARFRTAPVTQHIVDRAGELFRGFSKSHGMDPNDALLAASVLETGGSLYTLNTKHFPVPGLSVYKGW